MARTTKPRERKRGTVVRLPSGTLRVRVYAGIDPVTGQRHYLQETVPDGPKAAEKAEKVRTKLLSQVDDGKQSRTASTVAQLMARYLEMLHVEESTRAGYEGLVKNHIVPLLGDVPVGRVRGEVLDSFYAQLRACRRHCRGARGLVDHRTHVEHACDDRCRPHQCRPLGEATIRQAHVVLNSAFTLAERWEWIGSNPVTKTSAPTAPKPNPEPPTASQAARIATAAWSADASWGLFVWLAMTTGARRGELCAVRWTRIDFATGVLTIRTSIGEIGGRSWEKDTKTHQQRRIVLDPQTLALLRAFLVQRAEEAAALSVELPEDGFVFSPDVDGSTWLRPGTATHRYHRMCSKLGYSMHLHQLRHYSATELIAAGVDVRTVAGRLGHGGGGTTTLRVYSAWVAEADQRASGSLAARMPELPGAAPGADPMVIQLPAPTPPADDADQASPYRRIAADLRAAIRAGVLRPGDPLPTEKELAQRYGVSAGTAHRAVALLATGGAAVASRGRRARVVGEGVFLREQSTH